MRLIIQYAPVLRSWLAVLVIATANIGQAQSRTTTITGTVTDVSGALVPKASVSLETASGPVLQAIADNEGRFAIEAEPGEYVLKASSLGFMTYRQPIHLVAATPITKDVKLQIGRGDPVVISEPVLLAGPEVVGPPQMELLNASLTSTLPLGPLPPFKLHSRRSKNLSR